MLYAIRKWGLREVMRQWWLHSFFRGGELVGVDAAGNKYFEVRDPRYFQHGRDRYVEYGETGGQRTDAAMIPSHWHGWLHHTHADPPKEEEITRYPWIKGVYTENLTGSDGAYRAVPSVPKRIESFQETKKRLTEKGT